MKTLSLNKTIFYTCIMFLTLFLTGCGSDGPLSSELTQDTPTPEQTRSVTLSWEPSPSNAVAGYKIYYNSDEAIFPLGVFGANEGTSPIDVGLATSTTLTGFSNEDRYYLTVTAYDLNGNESAFSNIVSTD